MKKQVFKMVSNVIIHNAKKWLFISIVINIILGFIPLMIIWLSKQIINEVALIIQSGTINIKIITILLISELITLSIREILPSLQKVVDTECEQNLDIILSLKVTEKSSNVPLLYFDNPDFNNHLERIHMNKGSRFMTPVKALLKIFQNTITVLSLLLFLINIDWKLAIITSFISIPVLILHMFFGKQQFNLMKFQTPAARKSFYYSTLLNTRTSASEIRLFQLKDIFIKRWKSLTKKNNEEALELEKKRERAIALLNFLSLAINATITVYLIILSRKKVIDIGGFVSALQTVENTRRALNDISSNIALIYSESLYINDLISYLNYDDPNYIKSIRTENFPVQMRQGIKFEKVSFKYPYSDTLALDNISFDIKPGERIAIVGDNGSGKTTLVKCIMGLYQIDSGKISFDGVPLSKIKEEDVFKKITVIFQDFMKYNFSLKDNIILNSNVFNSSVNFEEKIINVTKQTGVYDFVKNYPRKFDTILGKVFTKGEDLSSGQWQKIALSRALYKEGEIFILDEPTSALDPLSELEIYEKFDALTKGKTTIFISHRMASTRLADKIIVLKKGKIVEIGTQHELLANNGEYAKMYKMQSKWFEKAT
ncbi:ABC transporter ATP-binding protein [Virgibacillus salexigens]|uniref:ABC transporter ATP-binding protein n=1 Tax=Virgibacillus massiliensis TaxID=1462526 RepID=UPI00136E5EE0|nr:ABC transporter ATP-binding protein [Virgibacillus massiliensis]MYL43942.1 ATP-binding cassette domain-containing protein [Virgibacillus massiliensis]